MIRYELEEKPRSAGPVSRVVAVGDAAGDATPWLALAATTPVVEIRRVSLNGTRDEVIGNVTRKNVAKYVKDQDNLAIGSEVVIEVKQAHEDDDQAGVIETVTGTAYIQVMRQSDIGDLVRIRIASHAVGENIFMQLAGRGAE